MANDSLIEEIKETFQYDVECWRENYKEGDEDMRFVLGDSWPEEERKVRAELGRPCLSLDELSQYLNQRINDIRQNKRAIKISPAGNGANERGAELRADIIRTIESKGGIQAYIIGYENALQRGIGFWAVGKRYINERSFDQELYIRPLPNSRTVYIDPDAKEPACADSRHAFIIDDIPKTQFKKRWPRAKHEYDFSSEVDTKLSYWFRENSVQVAEYWKVETKPATLLMYGRPEDPQTVFKEDLAAMGMELGEGGILMPTHLPGQTTVVPVLRERKSERRQIRQYITNGVEILEENEWEGRWIPIVPCFGRQYWIQNGAGSKRIVESMIRKARDAQRLHNYIATAKMEAIGQVLKAPYIGYEGQIDGHEEEWKYANKRPLSILLVKPIVDAVGSMVLPLPQRNQWDPAISGYEIADESAKRSIQNALGMYSASVGRHDINVKSGVAIRNLELQSSHGGYHFIDNFDVAIQHTGYILDEMIPHVYDTQRELILRKADETTSTVIINEAYTNEKGELVEYRTDTGRYDVTVSTGPSFKSQREMAEETADLLLQSPAFAPLVADLAIKMKGLGPIGDQIAERLTPPQFATGDSPAALKAQLQQMTQMVQLLTEQLNKAVAERDSKQRELESRERIAALQAQTDITTTQMKISNQQAIATVKEQLARLQMAIEAMLGAEELIEKDKVAKMNLAAQISRSDRLPAHAGLSEQTGMGTGQMPQVANLPVQGIRAPGEQL